MVQAITGPLIRPHFANFREGLTGVLNISMLYYEQIIYNQALQDIGGTENRSPFVKEIFSLIDDQGEQSTESSTLNTHMRNHRSSHLWLERSDIS